MKLSDFALHILFWVQLLFSCLSVFVIPTFTNALIQIQCSFGLTNTDPLSFRCNPALYAQAYWIAAFFLLGLFGIMASMRLTIKEIERRREGK